METSESINFKVILLIIVILVIIALLIFKMVREHLNFVTTRYVFTSDKLCKLKEELKIVFLSDLHNRYYGERNNKLLEAIKAENPDLILIGGDMVVSKFQKGYGNALHLLRELPKLCQAYAVNGNHEQRMKDYPEKYGDFTPYKEQLIESGIKLLENDMAYIFIKGVNMKISGLEFPLSFHKEKPRKKITRKTIKTFIGSADDRNFQILLTHYPKHFPMYKSWGADLTLAGHLHGGMVRIPGWRGVISPNGELFPKYSGEMTIDGSRAIIVSRGLGNHTIPIRLFNPAEIVVLTLNKP